MSHPDTRSHPLATTEPSVDPLELRGVLRNLATGVTIVTADGANGPAGVTVNSFASVSLEPPLVLFCIARTSRTWPAIESAGCFAVSFLTSVQERLARRFCATGVDRFAGEPVLTAVTGAPILSGAAAYVDCRVSSVLAGGDHHIVLGEVLAAGVLNRANPLVFAHGAFRPYGVSQPGAA